MSVTLYYLLATILAASGGEPCRIVGATSDQDARFAMQACEAAQTRFEELFRTSTRSVTIVLSGDTDDPRAEWVLHWHTSDDLRQFAKLGGLIGPEVDAYVAEQWEESLPHEIGHVLVWQHLSTHWTPPIPDEYATPLVDWFEEAVAIWMEPPHLRNQRLAIARIFSSSLPPTQHIAYGQHPREGESDRPAVVWVREYSDRLMKISIREDADGRVSVDTQYVDYPDPGEYFDGSGYYYPQVYSLLAYIHEVGGDAAIDEIVRRLRANPRDPDHLLNLPNLPADLEALDHAWRAWLKEQS